MKQKPNFSHLLQKKGLLKNFSIAKIVPVKQIDELKKSIKENTKDEAEFQKVFGEEMKKIGNMHGSANPIPGIIYEDDNSSQKIKKLVIEQSKKLRAHNFTKTELCFYVISLIASMNLKKDDFKNIDSSEFKGKNPADTPYKDSSDDDESVPEY